MDVVAGHATDIPIQHRFDPYTQNGGSVLAIAGEDFAVIAGDTRLTDGQYGINTRYAPKVWEVGDNIVISANGYSADGDTLVKRITQRIEVFYARKALMNRHIIMHINDPCRFRLWLE